MQHNKNKINVEYLTQHCGDRWFQINAFDEIDSTNNWLKGKTHYPSVCLAEMQTNGRGRNGNRWLSPDAENIYLSFNWSFDTQPKHLPLLGLWVGVAVAEAIEALGVSEHGIKWPNDLYWQDKKIGGILIETSSASQGVIVGIGINTNVSTIDEIDQPWISLNSILGHTVDRDKLLVMLLDKLYQAMHSFEDFAEDGLVEKWPRWDVINGKQVSFKQNDETLQGVARGINRSGYLLVEMESGDTLSFNTSISKVRW